MLKLGKLNAFKRPFIRESLDAWCKTFDDVSKIAILATPTVIYSDNTLNYKIINSSILILSAYIAIYCANFIRKNKNNLTKKKK